MKRTLVIIAVSFIAGAIFHGIAANTDPTNQPTTDRVVMKTIEVEVPGKTITKTVIAQPEACVKAVSEAQKMLDLGYEFSAASGEQLNIMTDAQRSIFENDAKGLGELQARQRNLDDTTSGSYASVAEIQLQLKNSLDECALATE